MINDLFILVVVALVFSIRFNAIKIRYRMSAWLAIFVKLTHNFLMFVVEKCTSALNFIQLVLSSSKLTTINAFKINRVQVSELPLLLLADPEDAGVEELLMVLDFSD